MKSKFDRKTHFSRLGLSTGIGALAILTGACSESAGTDSDVVPANTEAAAEGEAASTDGENSTDIATPAASTGGEGSTDTEVPASTDSEDSTDSEGSY